MVIERPRYHQWKKYHWISDLLSYLLLWFLLVYSKSPLNSPRNTFGIKKWFQVILNCHPLICAPFFFFFFEETELALICNSCPVVPLVAFLTTKSALKGIISIITGRGILLNCFRKKKDSKLLNGVLIVAWAQGPRVTCIILSVLFSGADGVRTSRKRRRSC